MALQHVRSNTANKRPVATGLSDGQIAVNYNVDSPGLFFKDSNNTLVKVGPVHVGTTAPNVSPAGSSGNSKGESWLDTSGTNPVLKVWNGSAWQTVQPVASGTVVSTADTGSVTSAMILNGTIVNDDINASAGIVDTKLATISTANKVSNSATTATSANTASAIVARDASGNFTAGTITASLTGAVTGNASTATTLQTARNINGTSFNGSADITTANWGTSRTVTIGSTGKAVNGSANVSWSISEIGAVNKAGDTMTGALILSGDPITALGAATKQYVDSITGGVDAMVYKGTLGTGGTYTALPTSYSVGWTIRVITAGTYAGQVTEVGDLLIAIVARAGTGNLDSDWTVAQTNIDGAVTGPASATDNHVALFNGTSGKSIKSSGVVLGNGTLTVNTSGTGLSGSGTFTANQSTNGTITITSNATSAATASAIVARDASGNFSAGTITAALTGNASTATALSTARTFAVTGDITGSVSSDLTSGASIATSIAAGVIVNADVNASAAIAGTKISPDFGSQNIVTTGTVTAASLIPSGSTAPTNGIYLPSANAVGIASNGTERIRILSNGNIGIGGSGSADVTIRNQGPITGSTISYANYTTATVQSDVTVNAVGHRTFIGTAAAAFTLTSLTHYRASQGAFGAGSEVGSQYGFFADNSLVGATTRNIGFYSDVPSLAGRNWNFYAADTADNYFAGNVGIGRTTPDVSLEVAKAGTSTTVGPVIRLRDTYSGSFTANTDSSALEFFSADGNGPGAMVRSKIANTVTDTTGIDQALTFWTTGSVAGNTLTRRMTIHGTGNVSINTTTDSGDRLYVNGTLKTTNNIIIDRADAQLVTSSASGYLSMTGSTENSLGANIILYGESHGTFPSVHRFRQAGTTYLQIANGGSVSINTTADVGEALYVNGNVRAVGVFKAGAADTDTAPGFTWAGDENTGMFRTGTDSVGISAGGAEIFRADLDGSAYSRRIYFESSAEIRNAAGSMQLDGNTGVLYLEGASVRSLIVYNTTTANAANVFVSSAGVFQRSTSSIKYKTEIETADINLSENLVYNSEPVWYRSLCDGDPEEWSYWGFIAEEVAEIDPRMVHWGDDGPESVQYDRYVVHLVNVIQQQKQQLDSIEARLAALEAN